jgi:hypothetical protein
MPKHQYVSLLIALALSSLSFPDRIQNGHRPNAGREIAKAHNQGDPPQSFLVRRIPHRGC